MTPAEPNRTPPSEPAVERPVSLAKVVLHLLFGGGVFLLASAAVRTLVPGPEGFEVTAKLRYFRAHAAEFDAVLVGSSGVFRHFVPEVIDARLAERGRPSRTFNLGGPGLTGHEADAVLRAALETPGQRLRYVVMEPTAWNPKLAPANLRSTRTVDWHDLRQTLSALRGVARADEPLAWRLDWGLQHARLFFWRLSNYGQGPRIAAPFTGDAAPPALTRAAIEADRGYQALEDVGSEETRARREALLGDVRGFGRRVGRLRGDRERALDLRYANVPALVDQVAAIRAAGAAPIYVVSPLAIRTPLAVAMRSAGHLPNLTLFNRSDRYPDFYRIERRFDVNHLSREGARRFSLAVADALAELLAD